jgi:hypothetical protein
MVADAVLYEGYLLYPYTAASAKNRLRWQFGVLGPAGAAERGDGEPDRMSADLLLDAPPEAMLTVHLRGLHLQTRSVEAAEGERFVPVAELRAGSGVWLTFDEAVQVEVTVPVRVADLARGHRAPVVVPGARSEEPILDAGRVVGRVVRCQEPVSAALEFRAEDLGAALRVSVRVMNTTDGVPAGRDRATRSSLLGTHLLVTTDLGGFVSLLEPPADLAAAAAACDRDRWFPVLAGAQGEHDLLLVSPIILYDHPEVAPESAGPLYDATEIDEILTLRVLTLSDEEKAAARATDPRAAAVVELAETMPAEVLARLHGVLRDPHAPVFPGLPDEPPAGSESDSRPWWDPAVDGAVDPGEASVTVDGTPVRRGSLVRIHPRRRADAQDLFYAGREATVAAVQTDVDGGTHVAVVLVDDPAADLHEWYGRHLYFAPEELEPVPQGAARAEGGRPCAPSE